MKAGLGLAVLMIGWPLVAASGQGVPAAAPGEALFRGQVRKVLSETCVRCHNPDQKKGGLDLSRRAGVVKGGDGGTAFDVESPAESLLLEKVESGEMPPKGKLPGPQVEAFRGWVLAGAPYHDEPVNPPRAGRDWWSLQPVKRPPVPRVGGDACRRARNPIDAFIVAKLDEKGLSLAPEADRATLIRRLSFDLVGLPPPPEDVASFVRDPDPEAYEKLVDRLLASPQYGERWGRHWMDVVRFGESEGYETNMPRFNAWPYRDYAIRSFNRDTPFPRFVAEQLAGDGLDGADWLTRAATGFLVGGTHDIVGNQTVEGMRQQRMDDLDDMITATGTAFLGLTVNCTRCHDHKFDPITQKDYYGLQAIFAGVSHGSRAIPAEDTPERRAEAKRVASELARTEVLLDEFEPPARPETDAATRPMVGPRRNVERFGPVPARFARMTILTTNQAEPCIDEFEVFTAGESPRNVALASAGGKATASSEYPGSAIHRIVHLNDGLVGNSHSWISRVPGKGTLTIEWPNAETIDRIVWGRDREGQYADRLATEYYIEVAEKPGEWRVVASSVDRTPFRAAGRPEGEATSAGLTSELAARRNELKTRQAALRARLEQLGATVSVYAGMFSQPGATHVLRRGDPMQPGPEAVPSGIAAVGPALVLSPNAPERERRMALARWIGDPANPLPARVMVNRVWHFHFGQGIVATPSDFGFNGGVPSHPELLDWLASEYAANGWRLKPLHRLIVTSATYRQSSRLDARAQAIDGQNRLLWRMRPRRLEAEPLRDAILACSGRLDPTMGGPGYNIWEKNTNYVAVYTPRGELGPDAFRRMVYQFKPRSQQDPTFGAFDCPDAALVAPRRNASTTALQALNLLNSGMVLRQAAFFAERLKREASDDPSRQADRGFALALGRSPSDAERSAAAALIRSHGTATFCRALYNANEFVFAP